MAMAAQLSMETQVCSRCGERQSIDSFYFISRKTGKRRGQCKACMTELKAMQKDPSWRPSCSRCGSVLDRLGPGRRLCAECFADSYDEEDRRENGAHRLRLKPCKACGVDRLREDHVSGTMLCAVCRSVTQSRRKRLKQLYNMTPREYVELLEAQRYRCAICDRKPSKPMHVDHQHAEPMIVRGLICASCNTLLGLARDLISTFEGAIAYLREPPAQRAFPGRVASPEANRHDEYRPLTRKSRGWVLE
jgi:hypothetical protein